MDKLQAIELCKSLLAAGVYSRPSKRFLSDKWDVVINHPFGTIEVPSGLTFLDCIFYRWEGMRTVDYPLYGLL